MWKVAKLSKNQLRDIRPEDVLDDGWFRKCETYRGGGGYDQFASISKKRFGVEHHLQFIVQLFGCNLDCPYCYVTREGVWGEFKNFTTSELIECFMNAVDLTRGQLSVFHLMGGAPALQLLQWPDLIRELHNGILFEGDRIFHSDLMLTERPYDITTLLKIAHPRALYAVDIKGLTQEEHLANTRKPFKEEMFWQNLARLEFATVPYYFTFTNISAENQSVFWEKFKSKYPVTFEERYEESFNINLIDYKATKFVDSRPWGQSTEMNNV